MKVGWLVGLILALGAARAEAQSVLDPFYQAHWARVVGVGEGASTSIYAYPVVEVAPTPNGGVVVLGQRYDENEELRLSRFDWKGRLSWARDLRLPTTTQFWPVSLAATPDGDFVAAAYGRRRGILARFSGSGDLEWARELVKDHFSVALRRVIATGDGGIVAAGTISPAPDYYRLVLARLSPSGELEWLSSYGGPQSWCQVNGLCELAGGEVVVHYDPPNHGALLCVGADGEVAWARSFNSGRGQGARLLAAEDGSVLVLARSSAIKLSGAGGILWRSRRGDLCAFAAPQGDGWLTIGGFNGDGPPVVHRLAADGTLEWSRRLQLDGFRLRPGPIVRLEDPLRPGESFVLAGGALPTGAAEQEAFLAKLRWDGTIGGDCDLTEEVQPETYAPDIVLSSGSIARSLETGEVADLPAQVSDAEVFDDLVCMNLTPLYGRVDPGFEVVVPGGSGPFEPAPEEAVQVVGLVRICLEPPPEPGLPPGDQRARRCNSDPGCPDCLPLLADGARSLDNPPWRAELYAAVVPFLPPAGLGSIGDAEVARLVKAFGATPTGRHFGAPLLRALEQQLARSSGTRGRSGGEAWRTRFLLAHALNAIDLDLVAPPATDPRPSKQGPELSFADLVWVSAPRGEVPRLAMALRGDVPARVEDHLPGWPVVSYRFRASGDEREPREGPLEVRAYYGGMRFEDPGLVRMLHWRDGSCEDITVSVDRERQVVVGRTDRLDTIALMQRIPVFKETRYRQ